MASSKNNSRFDLSDRLIHFFREVDLEGESAPLLQPEHFAFNSYVEGTKWPALFLLRCAVRSHRLWATWSIRGGRRTIYGPNPAVCFSEMPLAAFLEASAARERAGQAMSAYALTFPKTAMHDLGALPVIYGLSESGMSPPSGRDGGLRLLSKDLLPLREQYRYVTYQPTGEKRVDWTHEREWRWPCRDDQSQIKGELIEYGIVSNASDIPGLDFSVPRLSSIGIIVKTAEDARRLEYDVLSLVDRGVISRYHFDHILVLDNLGKTESLYSPSAAHAAMQAAAIDFNPFFEMPQGDIDEFLEDFASRAREVERKTPRKSSPPRELGGCWLWFYDNTSAYVRALVAGGRVSVNKEGRYIASLPEFSAVSCLQMREQMTKRLAGELDQDLGLPAGSFKVLGSDDPDAKPFFIDRAPDDDLFHNTD